MKKKSKTKPANGAANGATTPADPSDLGRLILGSLEDHGALKLHHLAETHAVDEDVVRKALAQLEKQERITFDYAAQTYALRGEEVAPESKPDATEAVPDQLVDSDGRITRYLDCALSKDEIDEIRVVREGQDEEIERLQAELDIKAKEVSSLRKQIESLHATGLEMSRRIRTGHEMRHVACEDRREKDAREGSSTLGQEIVVSYRLDTDEAYDWRPLSMAERQGKLWDDAPAPTPPKGENVFREATEA